MAKDTVKEETVSVASLLHEKRQVAMGIREKLNRMTGFPDSIMKISSNNGYQIILEVNAVKLLKYLEERIG